MNIHEIRTVEPHFVYGPQLSGCSDFTDSKTHDIQSHFDVH